MAARVVLRRRTAALSASLGATKPTSSVEEKTSQMPSEPRTMKASRSWESLVVVGELWWVKIVEDGHIKWEAGRRVVSEWDTPHGGH